MLADRDDAFGSADLDPDAVGQRFDLVRLRLAVEQCVDKLEADPDPSPAGAL